MLQMRGVWSEEHRAWQSSRRKDCRAHEGAANLDHVEPCLRMHGTITASNEGVTQQCWHPLAASEPYLQAAAIASAERRLKQSIYNGVTY